MEQFPELTEEQKPEQLSDNITVSTNSTGPVDLLNVTNTTQGSVDPITKEDLDKKLDEYKKEEWQRILMTMVPESIQNPNTMRDIKKSLVDYFFAVEDAMMLADDNGENFELPSFLPKYSQDSRLTSFPVVINVDVDEMTGRVGNEAFLRFIKGFMDKAGPLIVKNVHSKFDERFEPLDFNSITDKIYNSETGFNSIVVRVDSEKDVWITDAEYNDLEEKWEWDPDASFAIKPHIFREEYKYVCSVNDCPT